MIVAHLGPPLRRQGGPAGYLSQLAGALAGDTGTHTVLFPAAAPAARRAAPMALGAVVTAARRARRTWFGAPRRFRPDLADLIRTNGPVASQVDEAWAAMQRESQPSLTHAAAAGADVLVAHDTPTADAALQEGSGDRQVWLMVHNPMPLGLYLAWCWGVPEERWEQVAAYPDVRDAIDRERRVMAAVDRLLLPSPEAGRELVRADPRLEAVVARATWLLSGATGREPERPRRTPRDRREWRLPEDRPVGLFLGNALPYRGLDLLMGALDELPASSVLPGIVAVAGPAADGLPFHPRLRALGAVQDVADLLSVVDFVINVNRFSLFDLSIVEALEAGRPLLLAPVGGNLTVRNLGAGAVMLGDLMSTGVASGLTRMFALTAADRAALGARSRAVWEAHLSPVHLGARHLRLYDEAASVARTRVG
jgi:glycosyltransferase involved in cell wall biosynthesis